MALPLEALSLSAVLQPLFEIRDVITLLKLMKSLFEQLTPSLTRPEVLDHARTIRDHLAHAITFYEGLLEMAVQDAHLILQLYFQHRWDAPPVHGPSWR